MANTNTPLVHAEKYMQQNSSDRNTTVDIVLIGTKDKIETENLRKLMAAHCKFRQEKTTQTLPRDADNTDWCSDADNALH